MQRRGGFNLVELMIVVAIIGILVVAAFPAAVEFNSDRVKLNAARDVTQHLRGLRNLATTTNRAMVVTVTPGDGVDGENKGSITVLQSRDNTCRASQLVASPLLGFDMGQDYPSHNVQIVTLAPGGTAPLRFCMKPDGRVTSMAGVSSSGLGLLPDAFSANDCAGFGYETSGEVLGWASYCNRSGVMCLKVAYLNNNCPNRCFTVSGECMSHVGVDHIVTMNFTGDTRMVQ